MATYNKTGVAKYYVTTDTHCSPWGHRNGVNGKTIHFDLGDNTAASHFGDRDYPETMSVAAKIALLGNMTPLLRGLIPAANRRFTRTTRTKSSFSVWIPARLTSKRLLSRSPNLMRWRGRCPCWKITGT